MSIIKKLIFTIVIIDTVNIVTRAMVNNISNNGDVFTKELPSEIISEGRLYCSRIQSVLKEQKEEIKKAMNN
jgi:hypothetical protein